MHRRLLAALGCLLLAAVMSGCRQTETGPGSGRGGPEHPTPDIGTVTPAALEVDLGEGQTLGDPIVHRNLAIYPVRAAVRAEVADYLTLDEALAEGLIEVTEKGEGSVNTVLVTNRASLPIYLMAGEVILGGKQDRVVGKDTVIPVGAKNVEVPVYCVEQRRWQEGMIAFGESKLQASTAVRKAAQLEEDQGAVWQEVAQANEAAGAAPQTGAYRAGAKGSKLAEAAQAYVDAVLPGLESDEEALGVVVAIDGEVVSADVYNSQALIRKLQGKLVSSHARDAAASAIGGEAVERAPETASARSFLLGGRRGSRSRQERVGDAMMMQVESEEAIGFQTEAAPAAGAPAEMLHENYYSNE